MQEKTSRQQPSVITRFFRVLTEPHASMGKERDHLLENLSMLTAGGMSVLAAVSAVRQGVRSRPLQRILDKMLEDLESGSSFWKAIQVSKLFGEHAVSLVRIGEESGKLSDNLKLVAEQEAKEQEFQSKIRGAMMYPVFVLSVTVIVGTLIAWFILPRLATVFEQLNVKLPAITKVLIAAGRFLGEYGYIALPIFLGSLVATVYFVFYFPKTKFIGQSILFAIPGIHGLIQEIEIARFGYLLSILLQANIPVVEALDSLEKATVFPQYRKMYRGLAEHITDGNSFQKSFAMDPRSQQLIPIHIQQLVVAGEQSGNLHATLMTISASFEAKTEQTTKNISLILEPILLVVVWLGVVAVALAVILPIYSLIGGLNTDPSQQVQQAPSADVVSVPIEDTVATSTDMAPSTIDGATTSLEVIDAATSTGAVVEPQMSMLRILPTELGYLNVRSTGTTTAEIVGRVFADEEYKYFDELDGWYEIELNGNGLYGWVFGTYVVITAP